MRPPSRTKSPTSPGSMHVSAFETELLGALARAQRELEHGNAGSTATAWSRALYAIAQARGALRPSPALGKLNVERHLEARVQAVGAALVKRGLLRRRRLAGFGRQYTERKGYKQSGWAETDLWLTSRGWDVIRALEPDHTPHCWRASEVGAQAGPTPLPAPVEPDGELGGRCELRAGCDQKIRASTLGPDGWL